MHNSHVRFTLSSFQPISPDICLAFTGICYVLFSELRYGPFTVTGMVRGKPAPYGALSRGTDSRSPAGRQGNRRSWSGDRAGRRLRVKHRRIAVSRNGDPDPKRVRGRTGENVGCAQHAKDNGQSPHALAPWVRSPVRKCDGAVPRRDGSVRRQACDRDIYPGAARAGPVSRVSDR